MDSGRSKWEIELNTWPRKALAVGLTLVVCGYLFYQTWPLFLAAWITRERPADPEIYERAVQLDPDNADFRFALAQIYNYSTRHLDLDKAREQYLAAVRLNPYRAAHWLELSKFHEQDGNAEAARVAMKMALERDPNFAQVHWAAANLYIRLGDLADADYELRRTADLDVDYLNQVLDLVWRFYEDAELIVRTHVPNTKPANLIALDYFIRKDSEPGAKLAWERLRDFETEPRERFAYVDFLVNRGHPHAAYSVFDPEGKVGDIYNGGFERDLLNGGFDWRYSSWERAEARRDTVEAREGAASFRIDFDGEENLQYGHTWHWLPVEAGRSYELSFWMRTEGISTDEGVYLEVEGSRSEAPLGTTYWQDFDLHFEASSDLATVRVSRNPSRKLDNLLKGTVWLDGFSLRAVE